VDLAKVEDRILWFSTYNGIDEIINGF